MPRVAAGSPRSRWPSSSFGRWQTFGRHLTCPDCVSRLGMAVRALADRHFSRPVPRDPRPSSPVLQSGGDWLAFLCFVVPAFPVLSPPLGLGSTPPPGVWADWPVRVAWVAILYLILCVGTIDVARGWFDSRHPCDRRREGFFARRQPSGSNQNRSVATAVVRQ